MGVVLGFYINCNVCFKCKFWKLVMNYELVMSFGALT